MGVKYVPLAVTAKQVKDLGRPVGLGVRICDCTFVASSPQDNVALPLRSSEARQKVDFRYKRRFVYIRSFKRRIDHIPRCKLRIRPSLANTQKWRHPRELRATRPP